MASSKSVIPLKRNIYLCTIFSTERAVSDKGWNNLFFYDSFRILGDDVIDWNS